MTLSESVLVELAQCRDEGRDVRNFEQEACLIDACFNEGRPMEQESRNLIDKMRSAPVKNDYPYYEPDGLEDIKRSRPKNINHESSKVDWNIFRNKVYGAWLGRCAGCLLGKPIEGWHRERITGLLKDTDNFPLRHYISSDITQSIRDKYHVADSRPGSASKITWINNIDCAPVDDDTNYTVLNLHIMENTGRDFSSLNIAELWLQLMPIFSTCTAERVAYKNNVNLIIPPMSGLYYNAYREWIGAQIRADLFGYINPGDMEKAAEYAWRDGRISHVRNGIYGEMFVAAVIAKAAVCDNIMEIIRAGLNEIPQKSRLSEGIEKVIQWHNEKISWEEAINRLHLIWNEKDSHHWCHVISNAMICVISLLWGNLDFIKTIGIAISAGFDTDCNAATAGSITGMVLGADGIPESFTKPLNNHLLTGINGISDIEISELADKTLALAKK